MDPGLRHAVLGAIALALGGCGSDTAPIPERPGATDPPAPSIAAAPAPAPPEPEPTESEPPAPRMPAAPKPPTTPASLEVEGYNPASHVGPDAKESWPRPVVIVLHGNFDRPEWECDTWKEVAGFYGWILCPRGIRTPWATLAEDRWTYRGSEAVSREIEAAVNALEQRYPGRVTREGTVLVGFSLGAILAPSIVRNDPGVYPYVFLVEGGGKQVERPWVVAMKRAGVRAVGLAMSLPHLRTKAQQALRRFERAGIRAVFVDMKGAGHGYRGDFGVTGKQALEQMVTEPPSADAGAEGAGG